MSDWARVVAVRVVTFKRLCAKDAARFAGSAYVVTLRAADESLTHQGCATLRDVAAILDGMRGLPTDVVSHDDELDPAPELAALLDHGFAVH